MTSRGGGGRAVSRGYSTHGGRPARTVTCNRCRKPVATTVFVCACDCLFCEECTYSHFNNSPNCPCCQRTLKGEDFMELVVADPSSATEESLKNTFQSVFTKSSSSSNALSHQELCKRLLKGLDDDRRAVRFVLKQMVLDAKSASTQNGNLGRAYEALKNENTNLKQSMNSQKLQTDQTVSDLQHRLQAVTGTLQEAQKKLGEKDRQLDQFRQMYAADGMARVPSSSHSNGSNSSGGGGGGGGRRHGHHNNQNAPAPPMQGFVRQKQARERAKEQALGEMTRSRAPPALRENNSGNNNSNDVDSIITPIQHVAPPSSYRASSYHRNNSNNSDGPSPVPPPTPRIRDLSANVGYTFSNRSNKRSRSNGYNPYPPPSSSRSGGSGGSGGRRQQYSSFNRH